ncbi:MAG: malto-oligosyltrehalose synthase [Ilumatobacteraceae bacterium]
MHAPVPTATYRFQLTPTFGFDRVAAQLPRLQALGVSHVYLSPITEATPGSTHGYDVVDHTAVRAELGGLERLAALLDACAGRNMGVLVDHVPNHMSVGRPELNQQWWAMLRDGQGSAAAAWFDVEWTAAVGKVILPVLGEPLDAVVDRFEVAGDELHLGPQRFPLAPGTEHLPIRDLLAQQHYRLQFWRDPARNVRRFFTIDDLVAVRVADRTVAAVVDTVPRLLTGHDAFAGVRVDHVDGLADPGGYLAGLREILGDRWLVVEKILESSELLPADWPVEGTTGYEHATAVEHAMLDAAGWGRLHDRWTAVVGDVRPFRDWELQARREVLDRGLRPDLERVTRVAAGVVDATPDVLEQAVLELSIHLERYRTYLPDGTDALDAARDEAVEARPDLTVAVDALTTRLLGTDDELRTRWQQLTGPATAKGVEDRVFWRYLPLASLCEVGGHPDPAPGATVALHAHHRVVQERWPLTMLAGTTHDTKRAEDVRAHGLALAAHPDRWLGLHEAWTSGPGADHDVDPAATWLALQTVVTTPGIDADRLRGFLVKAAREADLRSSWADPSAAEEDGLAGLAAALVEWSPAQDFAAALAPHGRAVAMGLLAVRLTAPGVPDLYQGTEGFRYVLVDPDNRGQPDHAELDALVARAASLDAAAAWGEPDADAARAVVIARVLAARRALVLSGYRALSAPHGAVAFARLDDNGAPRLVTIVPRVVGEPVTGSVELPPGRWQSVLLDDGGDVEGDLDVAEALAPFPAVVLVRV